MKANILFLFLFGTVVSFSQTPRNVILLLNVGQSNAVGRALPDPAREVAPTDGTYWYKQSTNTLEPMIDGVGEGVSHATERSMNPMLCKRLKELTGQDVIIVPAAIGNTFISFWMKDANSLYTRAKTMWDAALAYCAANNITVSARYAHWLQGENDAGVTETDGYYVKLNQLTNDFISDFGVEKVFATRIGYDPNYTSAEGSEKIMKAQKLLNFNHPNFIISSNRPATFNYANGRMLADETHYSHLAENEIAEDLANAIQLYRTTGGKPVLAEPAASLQSVTSGYINLTPDWSFDFSNSLQESNGNATIKQTVRNWISVTAPAYTQEGILITPHTGFVTSRPFSSATFSMEVRFKMNSTEAWTAVLGNGNGGGNNAFVLYHNTVTSASIVQFGTATQNFAWDLGTTVNMGSFHTFKLTQANGVLKLFVDGVQKGTDKVSNELFTMSLLGMGADSHTFDMDGVFDYFKIKNTVDGIALPLKFKSFKATNIK